MIPANIFRAYDIRGLYPKELNKENAELVGKAYGTFLKRNLKIKTPQVVVGRDNRIHGLELQHAFIKGLQETGCRVTDVGLSPTPMLYFASTVGDFDAGCNVSASHNPKDYNGFKLVRRGGHAIFGDDIQAILKIAQSGDFEKGNGAFKTDDFFPRYQEKMRQMFKSPRPLKMVVDTGNGIAGAFYPQVLKAFGHEVIELYTELNGEFPNHEPDPVVEKNLTDLKKKVLEEKADLGLAFDGDGDRVGLITEKGEFMNADKLLMLLSKDALSRHPNASIVLTVSNAQVLFDLIKEWGGKPEMCKVGHSYVEHAMDQHRAILGGEQSGHFFLPEDYYPFDDALVAALRILAIASSSPKPVSHLFTQYPLVFSEPELRPFCPDDQKFKIIEKVKNHFMQSFPCVTLDGVRIDFGEGAWAGLRASNTSPCLSIILEAPSAPRLEAIKALVMEPLKEYNLFALAK